METVSILDINEDELLKALQATGPAPDSEPGWLTVEELASRADLGVTTIRKRLKALIKEGAVEYRRVVRVSLLGTRYHCNAFREKTQ